MLDELGIGLRGFMNPEFDEEILQKIYVLDDKKLFTNTPTCVEYPAYNPIWIEIYRISNSSHLCLYQHFSDPKYIKRNLVQLLSNKTVDWIGGRYMISVVPHRLLDKRRMEMATYVAFFENDMK